MLRGMLRVLDGNLHVFGVMWTEMIGARLASQMMAAKSGTRARTPRPSWLRVHRSRTRRKCNVILFAHRFLIPTPTKSLSLELHLSTQGR